MDYSNDQLINGIQNGDIGAFEELHKKYYCFLCLIAQHIVRNPSDAEEVVSDVFVKLWNIREKIEITASIKSYLVKAVRNTSLNYLKKNKLSYFFTEGLTSSDYEVLTWDSDYPLGQLYEKEIVNIIENGIKSLPDACREIFILSREKEMKYKEIADFLGISVNTVKKIGRASCRERV